MSRWSTYKDQAPKSGGKYVNLKDGDRIRFALTETDPGQEPKWWLDSKPVPEGTKGAKLDTKIVLCVYDVDAKAMRILRLTSNTFGRLCDKAADKEFGEDRGPRVYQVSRNKVAGKVTYEVDRLDKLTTAQIQARDREQPFNVLDEDGVEALPEQAAEPIRGTAAMPEGEQQPEADIPF